MIFFTTNRASYGAISL